MDRSERREDRPTEERQHQDSECEKSSDLVRHQRTQAGEKPYTRNAWETPSRRSALKRSRPLSGGLKWSTCRQVMVVSTGTLHHISGSGLVLTLVTWTLNRGSVGVCCSERKDFLFLSLCTPCILVAMITVFKNEQTLRKQLLTSVGWISLSVAH